MARSAAAKLTEAVLWQVEVSIGYGSCGVSRMAMWWQCGTR